MFPEKHVQEEIAEKFNTRQKVIIGVIVVVLLILVWQIVGLFFGGSEEKAPPITKAITTPRTGMQNQSSAMSNGTSGNNQMPTPTGKPVVQQTPQQPVQAPVIRDADFLKQQQVEAQYINALNQLQMLKIQREIAETNQAIANATLQRVTAEKNITEVIKPPPPPAPVPTSAYAGKLVGPASVGGPAGASTEQPSAPKETAYVVISVSMEGERWTAVIGNQGKLYSVTVGDILPTDGSRVVSINRDGVVLKKEDKEKKISIVSSI